MLIPFSSQIRRIQHVAPSSPPPDIARSASKGEEYSASTAGCSPEPENRRLLRPPGATGAFDVYSRRGGAYSTAVGTEPTLSKRARELSQNQLASSSETDFSSFLLLRPTLFSMQRSSATAYDLVKR
jgi:hypothetical protein